MGCCSRRSWLAATWHPLSRSVALAVSALACTSDTEDDASSCVSMARHPAIALANPTASSREATNACSSSTLPSQPMDAAAKTGQSSRQVLVLLAACNNKKVGTCPAHLHDAPNACQYRDPPTAFRSPPLITCFLQGKCALCGGSWHSATAVCIHVHGGWGPFVVPLLLLQGALTRSGR
jgi:hypothetical protein